MNLFLEINTSGNEILFLVYKYRVGIFWQIFVLTFPVGLGLGLWFRLELGLELG